MGKVPTPATAGLNCPPLTPVPLYVPPAGRPPVSAKAGMVLHTALSEASVTTGNGFTKTGVANDEADLQPFALVTVKVNVPLSVTEILCVVAPLLHK